MKILDADTRKEIVSNGITNILVTADAGCGKTTILLDKVIGDLNQIDDHKTIAAITFTRKATADLRSRLKKIDFNKEVVITTNDSFVENQIIRPFLKDGLGEEYDKNFSITYASKFKIYKDGLAKLKVDNELGVYSDNKKNFKFELAFNVLSSSIAAQQYLRAKFKILFLDEYQDSDKDMHKLFMYIKEKLNIPLFVVGDSKQAIYLWRGAKENIFDSFDDTFKKYTLFHNFRSHQNITNLANLLHSPVYLNNQAVNPHQISLIKTTHYFNYAVLRVLKGQKIDKNQEITIIINRNDAAFECAEYLKGNGYNFTFIPRTPIEDGMAHGYELKSIAKLVLNNYYSVYDFARDMNLDVNTKMIEKLQNLIKILISEPSLENYHKNLRKFGEILDVHFEKNEMNAFKTTLDNRYYHQAFLDTNVKYKIMTVFATKGLEFDQVIIRASDYPLEEINSLNNHYVALTRAKEKVIVIDNTLTYKNKLLENLNSKNIMSIHEVLNEVNDSE